MGYARIIAGVVYVGLAAACLVDPRTPRVFWTIAMPLMPVAVVLMGFHVWRRICPIAALSAVSTDVKARRFPRFLARRPLLLPFVFLLVMLVLRLVATNGDGPALGTLLLGLVAAAVTVNLLWRGKTWCNYVCPVGVVERLYTDAGALHTTADSRCIPCTGCKRACPDIGQERSYWATSQTRERAVVTWAFPGLVLGFYTYYWLREGEWAAFFDGRWTEHMLHVERATGPGLHFAPGVPAVVAATATLVLFAAASLMLFAALEALLKPFIHDHRRLRHAMLSVAAFTAFNVFYCFAGAPALAQVPGASRVVAFLVPVVATLVLVRRLGRGHVLERTARPTERTASATAPLRAAGLTRLRVIP